MVANEDLNVTEVLFYERPVPLNRADHRDLRIKPIPSVAFAAKAHSVPLTGVEFVPAARDMPVLFGGTSVEDAGPMALLGLRENENLMIDENGYWAQGAYVPAFVRRYPFVLAEKPEGAEGDDFTVFLDEAYPGFNTEEGERLFNEDGTDTEVLKNAVGFLGEFQSQVAQTRAFMKEIRELDLLQSRNIQISKQDGGQGIVLNGLFVINEEKLRELDGEVLQRLVKSGAMDWIYAHLMSLANIERLIGRLNQRATEDQAVGGNAVN